MFAKTCSLAVCLWLIPACGDNIDPLPEGLTSLEANMAPVGALGQLQFVDGKDGYLWLHGHGRLQGNVAALWHELQVPERVVATCRINRYHFNSITDEQYDFSFSSDNEVDNVVTVGWQETWRFGTLRDDAMGSLRRIRYQKTEGSSFISLIEGQIDISTDAASSDIDVQLIEHLDAIGGGVSDMQKSMQRRFDIMVALAQGAPVPACP